MSQELYKRFRPSSLKRMLGNKASMGALTKMLEEGKLPHTILFHGPSGTGKTSTARILASELDCHSMDLVEKNCSTDRGIDTIREIENTMRLRPMGGGARVWILDEVHMLTKEAQHGSLKMLEDTPSSVYFFLCTTDPKKLLPTIRNRCTSIQLESLNDSEMTRLIKRVGKKEGITVSGDVLDELMEKAEGSARRALVLLEQLRHLAPDDQLNILKRPDEEKAAIDLCRALMKGASWSQVAKILKGVQGDPESIRWAVLGYARTALLGGSTSAYSIICAFEEPFYNSKAAGLARACFEAVKGDN